MKSIANRGGDSVTTDRQGRAYVAIGQVFVYAPTGREVGRIDIPEPLQLLVGGADDKTLFVLTHYALYGAALRQRGTPTARSRYTPRARTARCR